MFFFTFSGYHSGLLPMSNQTIKSSANASAQATFSSPRNTLLFTWQFLGLSRSRADVIGLLEGCSKFSEQCFRESRNLLIEIVAPDKGRGVLGDNFKVRPKVGVSASISDISKLIDLVPEGFEFVISAAEAAAIALTFAADARPVERLIEARLDRIESLVKETKNSVEKKDTPRQWSDLLKETQKSVVKAVKEVPRPPAVAVKQVPTTDNNIVVFGLEEPEGLGRKRDLSTIPKVCSLLGCSGPISIAWESGNRIHNSASFRDLFWFSLPTLWTQEFA